MTTKITVDAHAGWPVVVTAVDRYNGSVKESVLGLVEPGRMQDFHITSTRDIVVQECTHHGEKNVPPSLDFADVVRGLKAGERYKRAGWNGEGMFIFLVPGSTFAVNREPLLSMLGAGTEVQYHAHIDMKTAQGYIVPWLASQADMLAEDWQIVE